MQRRTFLTSAGAVSLAGPFIVGERSSAADVAVQAASSNVVFSVDDHRVRFYSPAIEKPVHVLVVADTHLFLDDERGEPFRQYSARMAAAYHHTNHFLTGEPTNPEKSFRQAVQSAREERVDLLALVGDIVSFPSEAAIEWVASQLAPLECPYLYVAGNHDWHYEGMEGSLESLRGTWTERRLKPLYQGNHPLMAAYDVQGVRFLAIDNSHYEILPEQLEFFRRQAALDRPMVLFVHIPLYAPGRPVGFGCGHPDWGAASDRSHELERRPQWATSGHTQVTMDFHREVFSAPNLLGVFAGHIHRQSLDVINGVPQFVADANAIGAFLDVQFLPTD